MWDPAQEEEDELRKVLELSKMEAAQLMKVDVQDNIPEQEYSSLEPYVSRWELPQLREESEYNSQEVIQWVSSQGNTPVWLTP